ncbi:MarR family winged helix-turn-helix transcriptional regulator [Croceicoccus marinus]|uniref:ArsR family transcriptional regulator n=1 Tax=Croceicoccus marinus TaxID=450378 RepID=A0A217EZ06_9SPHN|nr:MarR family transcriptional regulator [Croceicoccus marinus]ARU18370.1 ArsR family transcriptional regulator [Croceicoccus marinus]
MTDDRHLSEQEGDELLRLDRQLCFPLYAATNLLQRLYRPMLEPLGLTYSQYLVMLVLWEREPVTVGELQSCLRLDVGTLSPMLKRMERAGLVTRIRDPRDERRVLIAPTPKGRDLKIEARGIPHALAKQVGVDAERIHALRELTHALVGQLGEAAERESHPAA